ncbi:hypothetical protein TRAPUB_11562 [Trametes pubescens]|uniref:F-box domain-containing protein n=1 Tax=Trametes pubescens TaxID=154538 RepID=A0A1M2VWJ9_TRAPU|nr:hypothetical protein TRAPUB_11562 [Trametes pubescens]
MAFTISSSSPILLDEQLPGPLYGLPAIDINLHQLVSAGFQGGKTDLRAQRQHFELELLSLRAVWNANLPIHTLPVEVLLDIFKYSLVPWNLLKYTHPTSKRLWAPLMGVCRHWCALIRNDVEFWNTIDISKSMPWLDVALHRSRGTPLRVMLSRSRDVQEAISTLLPHTDRVRHLEMSAPNAGVLKPLFSHALPLLSNLSISLDRPAPYGQSSRRGVDLIDRNICPHLETLRLSRYALAWTAPLLANLQFLSLNDCVLSTKPLSLAEFLDVLEHGQELWSLELGSFFFVALSSQTSVPPGRLVTLPKLSFLSLHAMPAHIARLMSHLRTLSGCDYELIGECSPNDPSTSYASFLPQDAALTYLTSSVTSVFLEVDRETHLITWDLPLDGSYRLELHRGHAGWDNTWLERGLRQLPAIFASGGARLTRLNVAGRLNTVSSATWDTIFECFPALQSLEFEAQAGSAFPTAILRSLSISVDRGRARTSDQR